MTRINLAGPWLWPWTLWHLIWVAGLAVVVPLWGWQVGRWWFTWLYAAFVPLEAVGAIDLVDDPRGPKRAKTLSQYRQFLTQYGTSWRWLAAGTGAVDGILVGALVGGNMVELFGPWLGTPGVWIGVAVGVALCVTVAGWLTQHLGWRERAG